MHLSNEYFIAVERLFRAQRRQRALNAYLGSELSRLMFLGLGAALDLRGLVAAAGLGFLFCLWVLGILVKGPS
jgi:hypothetical protein